VSRISFDALGRLPKKRSKYGAESVTYDGNKYQSRKEGAYAAQLDILKAAADPRERVRKWERQVRVPLIVKGSVVCNWYIDFRVTYADGRVEFHEVKGYATPEYKLKRKLFEAIYPEKKLVVIR